MGVEIIPFEEKYQEQIFPLLKVCLGEKAGIERDALFWKWKHDANPFGKSLLLIAVDGDKLVGLRAFMRWQWLFSGEIVDAVRAVDTVTHPDYQRKGIFSRLTLAGLSLAEEHQIKFVFNTPNNLSMPGYLKMGWQHMARLPMYVRILKPISILNRLVRRTILYQVDCASHKASSFFKIPGISVREFIDQYDIEQFIKKTMKLGPEGFRTRLSLDFLKWRYAMPPYIDYYVEADIHGRDLKGLLFYRTKVRNGLKEIMISDLIIADDIYSTNRMIKALKAKLDADYIICHLGTRAYELGIIRKLGFLKVPGQGMNFVVRSVGNFDIKGINCSESWLLRLGDLELF